MQKDNPHQFALYYPLASQLSTNSTHTITDYEIITRINSVLRLQKGESVIFFDQQYQVLAEIQDLSKKVIKILVEEKKKNVIHSPSISFWLPLLKKEALEEALYALAEMGAQEIQLIITEKSRRQLLPKEFERAQRILIAAAEQSKNFAFPTILTPITFTQSSASSNAQKVYCDPEGLPIKELLPTLNERKETIIMIGPEGDLTSAEKEHAKQVGFSFMALTPTVLRACQAASLSIGLIRSWFYKSSI